MNLVSLVMIGSNPHLAPPGSDVGLLSRFESGVQRVHLLSLLLLILPLPVPRREVQVFNKSVGKTGVREAKRFSNFKFIYLPTSTYLSLPG